jgi:nucleotide-binding universal stress UspA family protein
VIAGATRDQHAGMVVMGAVSRSSVKELFIGNTAERVLEEIESDLVVVPMAPAGEERSAARERVRSLD